MSTNLYWAPTATIGQHVGDVKLKYILQDKYGYPVNTILDKNDIAFLDGLDFAGISGAKQLIEAIQKYGTIGVQEQ